MGWIVLILLATATGGALWRWAPLSRSAKELLLAALLIGVAGYAWQGTPGEAGRPTAPRERGPQPDSDFAVQRQRMMGQFGSSSEWLNYADALHRMGSDRLAVIALKSGLRERPNDPDLWVGLGNALVLHSDGLVSPAAKLAFERAARIAPQHPGPPFFLGLAYAQAGQGEAARETWQRLLATTPADAPWRDQVEQRLAELDLAGQ